MTRPRKATVADIHEVARGLPRVTEIAGTAGRPIYQVSGRTFVFFRNPRPDAVDPETGDRYTDVVVFWVGDPSEKAALVGDETTPFFTTPHFNGHPSVLLRESRVGELDVEELAEVVYDAWLARAPKTVGRRWLQQRDG